MPQEKISYLERVCTIHCACICPVPSCCFWYLPPCLLPERQTYFWGSQEITALGSTSQHLCSEVWNTRGLDFLYRGAIDSPHPLLCDSFLVVVLRLSKNKMLTSWATGTIFTQRDLEKVTTQVHFLQYMTSWTCKGWVDNKPDSEFDKSHALQSNHTFFRYFSNAAWCTDVLNCFDSQNQRQVQTKQLLKYTQ